MSDNKVSRKVSDALRSQYNYILVVGPTDASNGKVSACKRDDKKVSVLGIEELLEQFRKEDKLQEANKSAGAIAAIQREFEVKLESQNQETARIKAERDAFKAEVDRIKAELDTLKAEAEARAKAADH